jgi:hypothetical protein
MKEANAARRPRRTDRRCSVKGLHKYGAVASGRIPVQAILSAVAAEEDAAQTKGA